MAINRNNRLALQEQEPDVLTRYRSPTPQKSFRPMPAPAPVAAPVAAPAPMAAAPMAAPVAPANESLRDAGARLRQQGMGWEDYSKHWGSILNDMGGGDFATGYMNSRVDKNLREMAKLAGFSGQAVLPTPHQMTTMNEGGENTGTYDGSKINPELATALAGYRVRQTGDYTSELYDPTGKNLGSFRSGDKPSKFDKLMEIALPALLTGGFGAAGAAAMGLSGLAGAAATGAIGSGLNTGIQGGNFEDVLKSALTGGVTGGVTYGIGQGVNAIAPKVNSTVSNFLADIGLPEELAFDLGEYTKPVLRGAATGVLKGDILGGITDSLAGQIVADISPSLKLTPAQGQAVANYLRTGDEAKLAISLGTSLARSAINAANNVSAGGTSKEPFYPADSQTEVPSIDEELGFTNYSPYGTTDEIMSIMSPATPADTQRVEVTPPQSPIDEELGFANYSPPAPQQVTVAGAKPQPEDELPLEYRYSGETSPIATGGAPQQVTVTGKKPVDEEFDLPPYLYEIPELAPMPIPEVPAPTPPLAPPLASAPAPAPAPKDNSTDIEGLLNMLALGQQQPVPSQVLAQMPGFNVGREMDYSRREQQPDLAALLAAVGYKG